jgi:hypothetical protein
MLALCQDQALHPLVVFSGIANGISMGSMGQMDRGEGR